MTRFAFSSSRKVKGKLLAEKIEEADQLEEQKDLTGRRFNEAIKKVNGEIRILAKEIDAEQAEREATATEAPWDGLIARTEAAGRRRQRDRTGEYPEDADG